ncbi:MAG: hypothetical protein FJ304_23780 [Planctomycetes bacterium]|nr:hypothetical protein [Planctomycetota bacterium]
MPRDTAGMFAMFGAAVGAGVGAGVAFWFGAGGYWLFVWPTLGALAGGFGTYNAVADFSHTVSYVCESGTYSSTCSGSFENARGRFRMDFADVGSAFFVVVAEYKKEGGTTEYDHSWWRLVWHLRSGGSEKWEGRFESRTNEPPDDDEYWFARACARRWAQYKADEYIGHLSDHGAAILHLSGNTKVSLSPTAITFTQRGYERTMPFADIGEAWIRDGRVCLGKRGDTANPFANLDNRGDVFAIPFGDLVEGDILVRVLCDVAPGVAGAFFDL